MRVRISRYPLGALVQDHTLACVESTSLYVEATPEGALKILWPDGGVQIVPLVFRAGERVRIEINPEDVPPGDT